MQPFDKYGCICNVAVARSFVVNATTLRIAAMGAAQAPATEEDLSAMEALLEHSLLAGAFGLSSGLEYPPASYSAPGEMVRLARIAARHGALYATHIRSEDLALWGAIAEAVDVGERSGCRVEISHLKLGGVRNWGRAPELLAFLDRARERGVDVAWDQYPYVAWGSSLIDYLPHWVAADGRERLAERLLDAAVRRAIRAEIEEEVGNGRHPLCAAPWDTVRIALVGSAANRHHEGRTIAQIAASEGRDPLEVVFDLLAAERGAVKTLVFCVDEGDIRTILRHPLTAVVTDGRAVAPYGVLGQGMIHPRYYGAFPRVLARYVRDEKLLTLESAIHRMTLMPARRIGLHDRGRIAPGFAADLTIIEEGSELLMRLKSALVDKEDVALPQFTSCSPGWIKYMEYYYSDMLPCLSTCKSPRASTRRSNRPWPANKVSMWS